MADINELGMYLKSIREKRRIPLIQIAQELKTKPETVKAIEANEFSKLPASTYAKGFLRTYAKYLELDPDPIIAAYNENYQKTAKQVLVLKGKEIPAINISKTKFILWSFIGILAIALLLSSIMLISHLLKAGHKNHKEAKVQAVPKAVIPKSTVLHLNTPLKAPLLLSIRAENSVWLRGFCDGKLIFEGILHKGEKKEWKAKKELKLRIGDPASLYLIINGNKISKLKEYPGPINVNISKKGIKINR